MQGSWYWQRSRWLVRYRLSGRFLYLTFNHGMAVEQSIKLDSTPLNFGGARWWLICPGCSRRVAHLHLPNWRYYFRCRHCYNLTYESAQASRSWSAAFFRKAAAEIEGNAREARLWVRLRYGGVVHEVKRPELEARERRTGIRRVIVRLAKEKGLSV
jgi:hypothetical protein